MASSITTASNPAILRKKCPFFSILFSFRGRLPKKCGTARSPSRTSAPKLCYHTPPANATVFPRRSQGRRLAVAAEQPGKALPLRRSHAAPVLLQQRLRRLGLALFQIVPHGAVQTVRRRGAQGLAGSRRFPAVHLRAGGRQLLLLLGHAAVVGQQRLVQPSVLLADAVVLLLRQRKLLFPVGHAVLPAVIVRLLLFVQQVVPRLQRLSLPVVGRLCLLPKLGQQRHQLLHILPVGLLPRVLRVAGAVPAGKRRRLSHGVLHGGAALLPVQPGVLRKGAVCLRIVGKRLPSLDLVVQRRQPLPVGGVVCVGPQRRHAVAVGLRRRHILRGRVPLLQSRQRLRRLCRWSGHGGGRRLLCRGGRRQQTAPCLVSGDAVQPQAVLLLIVPHGGAGLLTENAVLVQLIAVPVQLALQLAHRVALRAVCHHCIRRCHWFRPFSLCCPAPRVQTHHAGVHALPYRTLRRRHGRHGLRRQPYAAHRPQHIRQRLPAQRQRPGHLRVAVEHRRPRALQRLPLAVLAEGRALAAAAQMQRHLRCGRRVPHRPHAAHRVRGGQLHLIGRRSRQPAAQQSLRAAGQGSVAAPAAAHGTVARPHLHGVPPLHGGAGRRAPHLQIRAAVRGGAVRAAPHHGAVRDHRLVVGVHLHGAARHRRRPPPAVRHRCRRLQRPRAADKRRGAGGTRHRLPRKAEPARPHRCAAGTGGLHGVPHPAEPLHAQAPALHRRVVVDHRYLQGGRGPHGLRHIGGERGLYAAHIVAAVVDVHGHGARAPQGVGDLLRQRGGRRPLIHRLGRRTADRFQRSAAQCAGRPAEDVAEPERIAAAGLRHRQRPCLPDGGVPRRQPEILRRAARLHVQRIAVPLVAAGAGAAVQPHRQRRGAAALAGHRDPPAVVLDGAAPPVGRRRLYRAAAHRAVPVQIQRDIDGIPEVGAACHRCQRRIDAVAHVLSGALAVVGQRDADVGCAPPVHRIQCDAHALPSDPPERKAALRRLHAPVPYGDAAQHRDIGDVQPVVGHIGHLRGVLPERQPRGGEHRPEVVLLHHLLAVHLPAHQVLSHRHAVHRHRPVIADDARADVALRVHLVVAERGVHRLHIGLQIGEKAVILGHGLRIRLQIRAEGRHIAAEIRHRHILLLQPRRQLLSGVPHLIRRLDDHAPQLLVLPVCRRQLCTARRRAAGGRPGGPHRTAPGLLQLLQRQIQLLRHLEQIGVLLHHLLPQTPRRTGGHGKRAHGPSLPFSYTADRLYTRHRPVPFSRSRSWRHRRGRRCSRYPRVCPSPPMTSPSFSQRRPPS
nr:MAG TPA: hypothetical protein [Caudoviricetes sp.]